MEHIRRHRCAWKVLRALLRGFIRRKFNYDHEVCREKGPFLVLCNHNTDWDPLLLGCAFPEYLSFVASEHAFRMGFLSRLMDYLLAPVSRVKGKTALDTVVTIMRRLREGVSIAMFPEGHRSFNGVTGEIYAATGKLARRTGASLVTYRLEGGYYSSPRWAGDSLRRGRMKGRVVHVYSPEELKAMSVDEVGAAIRRDLYTDAYAEQRREMVPFKGKKLAEHLETVLCRCPVCGGIDTMKSSGDTLKCSCGFAVRYDEYGFLRGENSPFDNITDWDTAQTEALLALADAAEDLIFSDDAMVLREIDPETHGETVLGTGEMKLFRDRLELCGRVFPLAEIGGFTLTGPQTVDFSVGGRSFEVISPEVRCTRKYMTVIRHFRPELGETV